MQHAEQLQALLAPRLGGAEHIALPALLQVDLGEPEAVQRRGHVGQPLPGFAPLGRLGDQQAQPRFGAPADPAAQLVQLGHPEPVGVHDHHHGGVRHVHAHLDDRGRHEHIGRPVGEGPHRAVLVVGGQPPVHDPQPQPGQRALLQRGRHVKHGERRPGRYLLLVAGPEECLEIGRSRRRGAGRSR